MWSVHLPLGKDLKETLRDVQQLLEQHGAGTKLDTVAQGKFKLSEGYEKAFLKYMDRANLMLRLYRIWLDNAEYDRLARDLRDLQDIIQRLNDKGVSVSFLKEKLTFSGDADDAFAKLQLQMMGAFAEFERSIIRQRQAEGIARAKARGVYKGRQKTIDENRIRKMKAEGHSVTEISGSLGVSRMTVYRYLGGNIA